MGDQQSEKFEGWCIVELLGHRRLAGYVSEAVIAGHGMIRLDVPGWTHTEPTGEQEERGAVTQFYSPAALYCLTPTTEQTARVVAGNATRDVGLYALPRPAPEYVPRDPSWDEDDEDHPF